MISRALQTSHHAAAAATEHATGRVATAARDVVHHVAEGVKCLWIVLKVGCEAGKATQVSQTCSIGKFNKCQRDKFDIKEGNGRKLEMKCKVERAK